MFTRLATSWLLVSAVSVWVFGGWPQIWQSPPFPPKVQRIWAAQFARPDGDNAVGSWTTTPLWSKLDEGSPGDAVEISSETVGNNTDTSIAELSLAAVTNPQTTTGHIIRVSWRNGDEGGSNRTIGGRVRLRQGTTQIAQFETTSPGGSSSFVEDTYTLSAGEAGSITDYSNLNFEIWGRGTSGGPARSLRVDFVELEVPDAPPNDPPNAPTQDSPANSATGVSTTPTFQMTATDPDSDDISYKVTIFPDSGCTTTVSTHDQALNDTGWSGQDASCTNDPASCYASGTQGSFTLQAGDALSNDAQYWWRASAKDPDGTGTFTNSSTCNTFTTEVAPVISVSVSDGVVAYGTMPAGTSKSTLAGELTDMQTATNDGNVAETFNIKGQATACPWTLGATSGTDQYIHQFCNDTANDCTSPPTNYTALTASYQTLATGVAVSGTVDFQLRITVPDPSSCFDQQSVDVTVQAVQE